MKSFGVDGTACFHGEKKKCLKKFLTGLNHSEKQIKLQFIHCKCSLPSYYLEYKRKKKGIENLFVLFINSLQEYNPILPQFKYTNNNIRQNIHSQSNFNTIQNIILLCNIPHLTTISAFSISNLVYLVMIYFYPLFELISYYQRTCTNHVECNMQSMLA